MPGRRREAGRRADRFCEGLLRFLLAIVRQADSACRVQDSAAAAQAVAGNQPALLANRQCLQRLAPFAACHLQVEQGIEWPVGIRLQSKRLAGP